MQPQKKLWTILGLLLLGSFAVLLWLGREIYRTAPPVPDRVVTPSGEVIATRDGIEAGRQVWQSIGGQQLGSIWGHGGYVAPDWSADWLHREATALLDVQAQARGAQDFAALDAGTQATLKDALAAEMRRNTYDAATGTVTVSAERARAIARVAAHYEALFGDDPKLGALREQYAMRNGTVDTREHRAQLAQFVAWTAWAATTQRPGDTITYTS